MRLASLRLKNICQFRDFSYEFSPGVTTVLGANGAGIAMTATQQKSIWSLLSGGKTY